MPQATATGASARRAPMFRIRSPLPSQARPKPFPHPLSTRRHRSPADLRRSGRKKRKEVTSSARRDGRRGSGSGCHPPTRTRALSKCSASRSATDGAASTCPRAPRRRGPARGTRAVPPAHSSRCLLLGNAAKPSGPDRDGLAVGVERGMRSRTRRRSSGNPIAGRHGAVRPTGRLAGTVFGGVNSGWTVRNVPAGREAS